MDRERIAVRLHAPAAAKAPALVLRPWRPADAAELAVLHRDEELRRWIGSVVDGEAEAERWVREQERGWHEGDRFAFAVVEEGALCGPDGAPVLVPESAHGRPVVGTSAVRQAEVGEVEGGGVEVGEVAAGERLVGHVVLKRPAPGGPSGEVGYWTAAHARGRAVAPRALDALTCWAFDAFAGDGLVRLELLHSEDNIASCRVARKCGYPLTARFPAAPPHFPRDGHLHTRLLTF
ncbi:GNAT family N-acetyltransferase [Streptomyces sp. 351MFTsu5.1]|uniref:GNAT family N-acetyltransferase n=1 Tax=Streptomyces sp. 351MFTsu5.1 TaxID=1172180 RepID=UPI00048E284F|nr:GNAT family N-acetyltransferase [Streptomyces sp. 351MFTsu5.1]